MSDERRDGLDSATAELLAELKNLGEVMLRVANELADALRHARERTAASEPELDPEAAERLKSMFEEPNDSTTCVIFAIKDVQFIEMEVRKDELVETCLGIWNNPGSFYPGVVYNTDDAYYRFLKFLYVRYPNRRERRLADVLKEAGKI